MEELIATSDKIDVRHATLSDEGSADRLVKQIFPDDPYQYAQNIHFPNERINVVAHSTQAGLVGFASMLLDATPNLGKQEWRKYFLYIGVIAVDPQYCRRGIATRMLDLLAREAGARRPQYSWLHLHALQDNEVGIKFFENYGFERADETQPNNAGQRSWLMRKNIHQL